MNYSEKIKKYCNKHSLTQGKFAILININVTQINKIINYKTKPNKVDKEKLEKFFANMG
jgi:ribosome-binding protein aMBF1 (putative translation factor)